MPEAELLDGCHWKRRAEEVGERGRGVGNPVSGVLCIGDPGIVGADENAAFWVPLTPRPVAISGNLEAEAGSYGVQ